MQGIFGACTHTAPAFDAVGFCLVLAHLELHRADFVTFLAVDALFLFELQWVFLASEQVLGSAHRTERAPGPRAQVASQEDCNCSGHKAHGDKDHAYFFENVQGSDNAVDPVSHEAHEQEKDRKAYPKAP